MADIEIKGAAELQRALAQLPAKLEARVSRQALRAGAKIIEQEAKARVPVNEGKLRASIRVSTGIRNGVVNAQVKAGGRKKGDPFYAHFVEFGTKPHEIKPRRFKSLFIAGLMRKIVQHPGAKAKPFMKPAFDAKAQEAVGAVTDYIRKRLARLVKP